MAASEASAAVPNILREGKAAISNEKGQVFYNPAQVQNRDLSVAAIRVFTRMMTEERQEKARLLKVKEEEALAAGKVWRDPKDSKRPNRNPAFDNREGIRCLEALSATGLRSMRYALEIPLLTNILANDIDPNAVEAIRANRELNSIPESKVTPNLGDASTVIYNHRTTETRFDIVDLDPYGTAAPFLDGAVQAVAEGGLLCVTCTDMAVLCGNHTEACFAKYGSIGLKGKHCHEFGLRIVLHSLQTHASRYKRYIVPLLSVSMDFYVRLFVRVYTSPDTVKRAMAKSSYVHQCVTCGSFQFQQVGQVTEKGASVKFSPGSVTLPSERCEFCDSRINTGGPIWTQPMHDASFVAKVRQELADDTETFASHKRVGGYLNVISEELLDQPLFYDVNFMSLICKVRAPPLIKFKSAVLNAGYKLSVSHTDPSGIKTDAPSSFLWDVMRAWAVDNPPTKLENVRLKNMTPSVAVDFSVDPNYEAKEKVRVGRFLPLPEREWGPMMRAGPKADITVRESMAKRRRENQSKSLKKRQRATDDTTNKGEGEGEQGAEIAEENVPNDDSKPADTLMRDT